MAYIIGMYKTVWPTPTQPSLGIYFICFQNSSTVQEVQEVQNKSQSEQVNEHTETQNVFKTKTKMSAYWQHKRLNNSSFSALDNHPFADNQNLQSVLILSYSCSCNTWYFMF